MKLTSPSRFWHFVVHPSPREPGRWQLTRFEGQTPTGHTTWDSEEDAIASACGRRVGHEPPMGDRTFRTERRLYRVRWRRFTGLDDLLECHDLTAERFVSRLRNALREGRVVIEEVSIEAHAKVKP